MDRGKKLIKDTIILSFGTILPKLATFITLPLYTLILTKVEYGTFDLINILTSLIAPIITLQIQMGVFRFLISIEQIEEKKRVITTGFVFVLISCLISSIVLLISMSKVTNSLKYLIIIYLILTVFVDFFRQIDRGIGRNKNYSISSIINSICNIFFSILFLQYLNLALEGILISLSLSVFISLVYLLKCLKIILNIKIKDFSKDYLIKLLKYSLPMVPNSLSWWILNVSDRVIVTAFLGIEMNAIYAVSNKIPQIFTLFYNTFNLAWQESASLAEKDEDINIYYSEVFNSLYRFLSAGMMLLISMTPILFSLLVADGYNEAYYQMPILFLAMFFSSLSSFYGGIYVAIKNTKKVALTTIISAIINIVLNLVLIKFIGLFAASISTFLSFFIVAFIRAYDINKKIRLRYNFKNIITVFVCLLISVVLCMQNNLYLNVINFCFSCVVSISININIIKKIRK